MTDVQMSEAEADDKVQSEESPETNMEDSGSQKSGTGEEIKSAEMKKEEENIEQPNLHGYTPAPLTKKDRTLREFLPMMNDYAPIIPDAVTDYYLSVAGFECDDIRIKRLIALATQKFMSEIALGAYQYSRMRANTGSGVQSQTTAGQSGASKKAGDKSRAVLTVEDLANALSDSGVNIRRPEFYR